MEEKIKRLKELGIVISILQPGEGALYSSLNTLYIVSTWTDKQVEDRIDEKLKFYDDNKWPLLIKSFMNPFSKSKCDTCQSYGFVIKSDGESGRIVTWEHCAFDHFQDIIKERHEPVTYCKDYK
jgi:hypothetical protein